MYVGSIIGLSIWLLNVLMTMYLLPGDLTYTTQLKAISKLLVALWGIYFLVGARNRYALALLFIDLTVFLLPLFAPHLFLPLLVFEANIIKWLSKVIYGFHVHLIIFSTSVGLSYEHPEGYFTMHALCSFFRAYLILFPFVVSSRAPWKRKLISLVLLFPIVLAFNVARILSTIKLDLMGIEHVYSHELFALLYGITTFYVSSYLLSNYIKVDIYSEIVNASKVMIFQRILRK